MDHKTRNGEGALGMSSALKPHTNHSGEEDNMRAEALELLSEGRQVRTLIVRDEHLFGLPEAVQRYL